MRLKLVLSVLKHKQTNPHLIYNYHYPLSAALYSIFNSGDSEFARFLHQEGYADKALRFKFFTFSKLYMPKFKLDKTGFRILSDKLILTVSILPPRPAETFIRGLFAEQEIRIGNLLLKTQSVEVVPEPDFNEEMHLRTLSPLILSDKSETQKHAEYIHPGDARFELLLRQNLENKHRIYSKYNPDLPGLPADYEFSYTAGNKIRQNLITIKERRPEESKLKVFSLDFQLKAPEILQEIGYKAGFGEKNALGLGCCEVMQK
jgi:CRISPR-associated endoribonuclease Cas6